MKLKSIKISNYRSIEEIIFEITPFDDNTFTYGLIGVNEAGKSTVLRALALRDGLKDAKGNSLPLQKDFRSKAKPIEVEYFYELDKEDISKCKEILSANPIPIEMEGVNMENVKINVSFYLSNPTNPESKLNVISIKDTNEAKITIQDLLKKTILDRMHKAIFWTAEERYLISQPITLKQFAENPDVVSIPLKNCFLLTGISNIQERISGLTGDSTEVEQLEKELGEKVTEHINNVWPKHPIQITFKIGEGLINFHVKDLGASGKAKTADQRSDGFKQFISFLLTVSAQSRNDQLSQSILLLDEPETHLHPQAQEDLLRELIKITDNKRNNVVFFATHSNYMIDKDNLGRNYKIEKEKENTTRRQFDKKNSTYASVTYEVFDIASTDYHNELYSRLHQKYQDLDINDTEREKIKNFDELFLCKEKKLKKDKPWKKNPNESTLPTYIRNCIHHSDNGDTYKNDELRKSIELLRSYL